MTEQTPQTKAPTTRSRFRRRSTYLVGLPLLVAVLAGLIIVIGPYVYIHYIEGPPPAKLAFEPAAKRPPPGESTARADLDGTWRVTAGSQAGYRVQETLFGQGTTAVGRTAAVEGSLVLDGRVVRSGSFRVDLRTVTSDRDARDRRFREQIMDTARFPIATFRLSAPATLRRVPADLVTIRTAIRGRLTLHGRTRPVTVLLSARRNGRHVEVQGSIPVVFAEYGITNPSFGPAKTGDRGEIELLLSFERAG